MRWSHVICSMLEAISFFFFISYRKFQVNVCFQLLVRRKHEPKRKSSTYIIRKYFNIMYVKYANITKILTILILASATIAKQLI